MFKMKHNELISRRSVLGSALACGTVALWGRSSSADETNSMVETGARVGNPIAVSTYSFWQFRKERVSIEDCIENAARMGFDAVEILQRQMTQFDKPYLSKLKRLAFAAGLSLCSLSTHQGFLRPDAEFRQKNIDMTIESVELAYQLGIPIIRVNTGTWGTSKNFDDLMANRGVEKPIEGYTDEDAYPWVIEAFEKILPTAEKCGVLLGLENHWGLARTPDGLLRIIKAVNSPWLRATMDTGNFLEDPYEKIEKVMPETIFVQAKTYYGDGLWYTLDLDYPRIGDILRKFDYRGFVSLEFEGKEAPETAIPKSLAVLRNAFRFQ